MSPRSIRHRSTHLIAAALGLLVGCNRAGFEDPDRCDPACPPSWRCAGGICQPDFLKDPGSCSADGWCWQNPLPQANALNDVAGAEAGFVVAVGDNGTILHFDGNLWVPMKSGTTRNLYSVNVFSPTRAIAVGDGATLLRFDGVSWAQYGPSIGDTFTSVWLLSEDEILAATDHRLWRRQASVWSEIGPASAGKHYLGIWGSGAQIFVVGEGGLITRFDGADWAVLDGTVTTAPLRNVWGRSVNDVFAVGDSGTVLHFDGAAWATVEVLEAIGKHLRDLQGTGSGDILVSGDSGLVLRYDGARWTRIPAPADIALHGVSGRSADDFTVVGRCGQIFERRNGGWLSGTSGASFTLHNIRPLPPDRLCAVGDGGVICRENNAWQPLLVDPPHPLRDICANGPGDTFAVGDEGLILHHDGSSWSRMMTGSIANLNSASCRTANEVLISGDSGTLLCFDGSRWTILPVNSDLSLHDIWGTVDGRVLIAGDWGRLFSATSQGACNFSEWASEVLPTETRADSPTNYGIFGFSSGELFVSGAAGLLRHFDRSRWLEYDVTGCCTTTLTDVWGRETLGDIFSVDNFGVVHHWFGSWTSLNSNFRGALNGVWSGASLDVYAVGECGAIVHYVP